ncbi:MAG: RDD family protein [Candidatus Dormibacterales bacterium]
MARWAGGRVSLEDSVANDAPPPGRSLRESFLGLIPELTLGLVTASADALYLGPIELLRFGRPSVTETAVEWPIEGGWAAGAPGGTWRIESAGSRLTASVRGYRPRLPRPVYAITQLPIHRLLTRLYLLRAGGRSQFAGPAVERAEKWQSAAIDLALCAALARLSARRGHLAAFLGVAAGYHVACWTLSGRTLGGLALNQRVVATDGSRPSAGQAFLRLLALPLSGLDRRIDPDEIAGTRVVRASSAKF